jgi:alkylation response protein AidB-like acyl-CoA dehydrogenase
MAGRQEEMTMAGRTALLKRITSAPLRALARLGASDVPDLLHFRRPAEAAVYEAVRAGTKLVTMAARAPAGDAKRLAPSNSTGVFDPRPTDEQALMRDAMRRFGEEVLRPAARMADDRAAPPDTVLDQGHALGLAGLAIPDSLGGAATERSAVTNALIAEELARGDMGLAVAMLAPLGAVNAIVECGSAEQQGRYLPVFLAEKFFPAALALLEPRPLFDAMNLRSGAVRSPEGGWALWGEKSLVPLASRAEFFVVAVEVRGMGPRLFVVERGTPGLYVMPDPAMGIRGAGLGRLRLEGARVSDDAMLGGSVTSNGFDLGALVDRARIAWSAMAVGVAQAVLDYVIPYCNARQAFGEPISNRQAVAFAIADVAIEVEGMRLLVHRAAALADRGRPFAKPAMLSRLQCATKGMKIASDGVQLLGGHGFVKEHPVERWYRDIRAVGVLEGALLA